MSNCTQSSSPNEDDGPNRPDLSRPLDVHRWSDYPALRQCLSELVFEIEASENRVRKRSANAANRIRDAVRCLILDLYVAWAADPLSELGVPLGKDQFKPGSRYDVLFISYAAFKPAYDGLVRLGYVEVTRRHYHDPRTGIGRRTRVRPTRKLIELLTGPAEITLANVAYRTGPANNPIVLRDNVKSDTRYEETNHTSYMRSDVEHINAALASRWLDLRLSNQSAAELNAQMATEYERDKTEREAPRVDFAARRLQRIFNNEDWHQGGRFYGGWWQTIPKEYRRFVTIDDKDTVEIDYSGMHPVIMYAEAGAELIGDPYDIGVPNVPRDLSKVVFNKLINAKGTIIPPSDFSAERLSLSWYELQNLVRQRHGPIAHFFKTGHGTYLQNRDASVANQVMLRFLDMNYVCLPVHDSFIVHHALKDELIDVMKDEFRNEFGSTIATKLKFDLASSYRTTSTEPLPHELDFLTENNPYSDYNRRLAEWYNRNAIRSGS